MLAIVAAICFGVALLLVLLGNVGATVVTALTLGGLLAVAIHLAAPYPWRRP